MKAFGALLIPALAAAAFAAGDASAQHHGAGATGHWSGTHTGTWHGGTRHWASYPRWHGGVSFYFGVPLLWPAYYWGYPYYYDYPRTVVYREVERVPAYPDGEMSSAPAVVPNAPGAPAQGPLYMNYCESAKAYYPKVTSCPEGWRFVAPDR